MGKPVADRGSLPDARCSAKIWVYGRHVGHDLFKQPATFIAWGSPAVKERYREINRQRKIEAEAKADANAARAAQRKRFLPRRSPSRPIALRAGRSDPRLGRHSQPLIDRSQGKL